MELEENREEFRRQGLAVAAISYDSVAILKTFSTRVGLRFPLLSDTGSATIRAFGLLNTQIPETNAFFGVPYPGMYIVDTHGRITAKYFEREYQDRFTPDAVLTRQFGVARGTIVEARTQHLALKARLSRDRVRPGNRITLIADVSLPRGMHLYAPGVQGYRPVNLTIAENPAVQSHDPEFPPSRKRFLPAIKEEVLVYEGKIRISRDLTISSKAQPAKLEVQGTLEYQACDDKICYIPTKVSFALPLEIEPHDRTRVPEELRKKAPSN